MVEIAPRLLNPTLVPTWRKATTDTTPRQLAGSDTAPDSLPAEAMTTTPRATISSIAL